MSSLGSGTKEWKLFLLNYWSYSIKRGRENRTPYVQDNCLRVALCFLKLVPRLWIADDNACSELSHTQLAKD